MASNVISDWRNPNDPDNPRNFPLPKRLFYITSVSFLAFSTAFAGAIYAPAQDSVIQAFQCTTEVAVLPLSLYNLGLAFGPVIGAPLSERYGRRSVFVVTTPIFVLFMIGAGFARSLTSLGVCRFFAGMFASPNISNASATIMDCTAVQHRGLNLGIYYSIPSFAASLAPLVGGFVVEATNWRWTQWVAIMVTVASYVPVIFTSETYKKVILKRRAVRLGLAGASSLQMSPMKSLRYFATTLLQRPVHMLLTEPIVTLVSVYNGFIFGLLYAFIISVPWVARTHYGFNKTGETLSYLGVIIGTLLACIPFSFIDIFFYQKRLRKWLDGHNTAESFPPEHRLLSATIGSVILPVSLFIAAWTTQFRIHWIVPILFQGSAMLGCLLVYAGVNLFMLDSYGPLYGASASGAIMLSRYLLSFAFPLFASGMFEDLGVGWATSILAFITVLMAPIPWCFWAFGAKLRSRSKYELSQ